MRPSYSGRRRWLIGVVLSVGQLMIVLDGTAVNVALPSIQQTLHFSQANLAWVANAYLIGFAGLMLLAGRVGDLVGKKLVFLTGLTVFVTASLLCAVSGAQWTLIAARFIQGVGASITSSVILAMLITDVFGARDHARVIGLYTMMATTGGSIGLLLGGAITQAVGWHWIFLINVPIGVIMIAVAATVIQPRPGIGLGGGVDVAGSVLLIMVLMLAVYAIVHATYSGWASPVTVTAAGGSVVALAAFLRLESRIRNPLIPLAAIRSRDVSAPNLVRLLLASGITGQFFIEVLFLQRLDGYGALKVGLAFLPMTLVTGPCALVFTSRLVSLIGPKPTIIPGMLCALVGLFLLSRASQHASYLTYLLPAMVLLGLAQGIAFLPTVSLAMTGATSEDSGLRSGLVGVALQMGGVLGVAVMASVAASRTSSAIGSGDSRATALLTGYHDAFRAGIVVVALGTLAALFLVRSRASAAAVAVPVGEGVA